MVGKAFIIVESQGFDECFRDPCQHLLKCGLCVIGLALASPDPLIDRLVADAIDAADGPATADQLRAEFFWFPATV